MSLVAGSTTPERPGAAGPLQRLRVEVRGTVQGVGFRPYVYRLAAELGLSGFVLNHSAGVLVEVEGPERAVEGFVARLGPEAPPLAVVERLSTQRLPAAGEVGFEIRHSARSGAPDAAVTPDSATCRECLRELFDPADRRFRYPFINCTNCGPRFTIVTGIPYDRPLTTMAPFTMCSGCRAEYEDPGNRRFHAQPNACPECGPAVSLLDGTGQPLPGSGDAVQAAAAALRAGRIVAVKGVGGYHLACRADREEVVGRLRARKHREDKPFALMVGSVQAAAALVELGPGEERLLLSTERPIVLAPRRQGGRVAPSVAPGSAELGLMLPYSPLHHLLLADFTAAVGEAGVGLVMTSGNVSEEPIAYRDHDALQRLGPIADLLLAHDRPIHTRTDDSVVRVVRRRPSLIRRSRGYVPAAMSLPGGTPRPLLACGPQLKNTFCLAKGERAWVSHHVGDLENYETLRSFTEGIAHFQRLFALEPEVVVHDLHPDYLSTRYALERPAVELMGVQHHHAHLAACLAEHGQPGPAVGAIFDGSGYGPDGTIWGGELLWGDALQYRRIGALRPVRLPGGERAIREPWRMACAWLAEEEDNPPLPPRLGGEVSRQAWEQVLGLIRGGVASPCTTSMGRLFDAVAALCGVRARTTYEGQAAIELEAACAGDPWERGRYEIEVLREDGFVTLEPRRAIAAVVRESAEGVPVATMARRFHAAVAWATVQACASLAADLGTELVVLSGGVFQNRRLLEAASRGLDEAGLRVLVPERLPTGDGGVSYGQAAVAAARMREG